MRGIYLLPFPLEGESGKNRASRQKAEALAREVDSLRLVHPSSRSLIIRALQVLVNELRVVVQVVSQKHNLDFIITRGLAGFLCVPMARMLKLRTLREIHSISSQEARYINGGVVKKLLTRQLGSIDILISRVSDTKIFNHPNLKEYFKARGWLQQSDFVCYNGGAPEDVKKISKEDARTDLGLPKDKLILAFVGSASVWHGVNLLAPLCEELEKRRPNSLIVCGGGNVSAYDGERRLLNITPLDSDGSAKLIRASDVCLLPVRNIRISPGSPLKLYDYALNGRPVITQAGIVGYEDEVEGLGIGIAVDFFSPGAAADEIDRFLGSSFKMPSVDYLIEEVSWGARMRTWLRNAFGDKVG